MNNILRKNLENSTPDEILAVINHFTAWRDGERKFGFDGLFPNESDAKTERNIFWLEFLDYLDKNDHSSEGITMEILPQVISTIKVSMGDNRDYWRYYKIDPRKVKFEKFLRNLHNWLHSQTWLFIGTIFLLLMFVFISIEKIRDMLKDQAALPSIVSLFQMDMNLYVIVFMSWAILSFLSPIYLFFSQERCSKNDRIFLIILLIFQLIGQQYSGLISLLCFTASLVMVPIFLYSAADDFIRKIYFLILLKDKNSMYKKPKKNNT